MEKDQNKHDVLKILGTFGRYHWMHWVLVSLPSMMHTMVNINFVIVAGDMDYRCRIPECETANSTHQYPPWWPDWSNVSKLERKCLKPVFKDSFDHDNGICSASSFSEEMEPCSDWIYESNNSIVSELNLACQPWKINSVGVIHNVGLLCSLIIFGWMSDRFGRKPSLIFCASLTAIGLLKLLSVDYNMFVSVDFFEAFFAGGTYLSTSVMLIEFSTKETQVYAGVVYATTICFGELIFGSLALIFPFWKHLIILIYAPPILFVSYIFLIKESPRWLVVNGKIDQAKLTLEKIANFNKIEYNKRDLQNISEEALKDIFKIKNNQVKEGWSEILKSKEIMIRLLVGAVCRFTSTFVYYGILIYAIVLPGDKNTNFFLSTVMSLPGEFISLYVTKKFGRRNPLIAAYLLSGVMCISTGYISAPWGQITAFLIGKMLIAVCFTGVGTYVMELYPTSTRASLLSIGLFTSRIGALISPLTPLLIPISPALPQILFGFSAVLSSALLTLTPETKNMPLLETIKQVDEYKKALKDAKHRDKEAKSAADITKSSETIDTQL